MDETSKAKMLVLTKKLFTMFASKTTTKKNVLDSISKPATDIKKMANNTYRILYEDGTIAYRLHDTDVVTITEEGCVLNSGGWRTNTTKDRMNQYLPHGVGIYTERGVWYVRTPKGKFFYSDNMLITRDGGVPEEGVVDTKAIEDMKKMINKFTKLITEDNIPMPSNGDCWYCLMKTHDGQSLGDSLPDNDHLLKHMEEGYVTGSLIVNAMKEKGYSDYGIAYMMRSGAANVIRSAVRTYMQKRLIKNIQVR